MEVVLAQTRHLQELEVTQGLHLGMEPPRPAEVADQLEVHPLAAGVEPVLLLVEVELALLVEEQVHPLVEEVLLVVQLALLVEVLDQGEVVEEVLDPGQEVEAPPDLQEAVEEFPKLVLPLLEQNSPRGLPREGQRGSNLLITQCQLKMLRQLLLVALLLP